MHSGGGRAEMSYTMYQGRENCPGGGNVRGEYVQGDMSYTPSHAGNASKPMTVGSCGFHYR